MAPVLNLEQRGVPFWAIGAADKGVPSSDYAVAAKPRQADGLHKGRPSAGARDDPQAVPDGIPAS